MTDLQPDLRQRPSDDRQATALPSDLTTRELARWSWRQLTSMRTALVLLLLLALAAIPGSVIPQDNIDSLAVSQWRDDHPRLAPIWDRLDLFSVYGSVWFAAIYILLMISLVGCIIPRLFVYDRAMRAKPPKAPRHLSRLPESTSYTTDEDPDVVLARAARVMKGRRFRVHYVEDESDAVAAERGHLREAGNLVFHLAVIVVLVGVAAGSLFGYKGGVILLNGDGLRLLQQPDAVRRLRPGRALRPRRDGAVLLQHHRLRRRLAHRGQAGRDGARVRREARLHDRAGRRGQDVRPQGQPPAVDRRHRRLPHRSRLRAGDHDPRRRGRGHQERPRRLPADQRADVRVVRRRQGAVRQARSDRPRGRVLPDLRDGQGRRRQPHRCRRRSSARRWTRSSR